MFAGNEEWLPPTVADTKRKFYESYSKPLPAIYNSVIQEFLVAQHLIRYNKKYQYDEVSPPSFLTIVKVSVPTLSAHNMLLGGRG